MIKWHTYYVSDVSNSYQLYDGKDKNETLLKNVQGQTWNTKFVEGQNENIPKRWEPKAYLSLFFYYLLFLSLINNLINKFLNCFFSTCLKLTHLFRRLIISQRK